MNAGQRIPTMLLAFNLRVRFKPSDFTMPPSVCGNPSLKAGALKDITIDFEELKRQYYKAMGYDADTSSIKKETAEALGLQDIL